MSNRISSKLLAEFIGTFALIFIGAAQQQCQTAQGIDRPRRVHAGRSILIRAANRMSRSGRIL